MKKIKYKIRKEKVNPYNSNLEGCYCVFQNKKLLVRTDKKRAKEIVRDLKRKDKAEKNEKQRNN